MNDFLLQIILAQRNDGVESLMNILFVVVLAAFWLIGGIIKAKANKSGPQDKQSPRKPVRRPPVHSKQAREQMLSRLQRPAGSGSAQGQRQQPRPATQKPRMKFADLQAAVRKFAVEADQDLSSKEKPEIKPVLSVPQTQPETLKLKETTETSFQGLQDKMASEHEQEQLTESELLSDIRADYTNLDDLRMAILHYEILGKPLSLRNPSEGGIGL